MKLCVNLFLKKLTILSLYVVILGFPVMAQQVANEPIALNNSIFESMSVSLLNDEQEEQVIMCFDVNDNGWFAVGYRSKTIQVYDQNGNFKYGYSFDWNGDYGIAFEEGNLAIYLIRSDAIIVVDPAGHCVETREEYFTNNTLDNIIEAKYPVFTGFFS